MKLNLSLKILFCKKMTKVNIFVDENPEILLPTNLDISVDDRSMNEHDAFVADQGNRDASQDSLKEPLNTQKWSEVVRKGKFKSKSRINTKCDYERHFLEFEGA
jgi:hypothetical protein